MPTQAGSVTRRMLEALRWLRDWPHPDRRAIHALKRHPEALQPFPTTEADRYPRIFDALAQRLRSCSEARILSFGCASGEEVRALRARLPDAYITGVDANPIAIAQARAADISERSRYLHAFVPPAGETFDAVLAMAVFRDGRLEAARPENCLGILPFARVDAAFSRLDAVLEPGGWLAIANAHFRLRDMTCGHRYTGEAGRHVPSLVYGPDDRRSDELETDFRLYRKETHREPG